MLPFLAAVGEAAVGGSTVSSAATAVAAGAAAVGAVAYVKNKVDLETSLNSSVDEFTGFDFAIKTMFPVYAGVQSVLKQFSPSLVSDSSVIDVNQVSDNVVSVIKDTFADSSPSDDVQSSSPSNLLEVLETNAIRIASAIERNSLSKEEVGLLASSLITALFSISQAMNNNAVATATIVPSIVHLQKTLDAQNLILSEIYGLVFDFVRPTIEIKELNEETGEIVTREENVLFTKYVLEHMNNTVSIGLGDSTVGDLTVGDSAVGDSAVGDSAVGDSAVGDSSISLDLSPVSSKLDSLISLLSDALSLSKHRDEAILDHLQFKKEALSVKDLDGNEVVSLSPRELSAIRDAVIAREKTDINNFELYDDDLDYLDLSAALQKLDLTKLTDLIKEVQNGS